MSASSISRAAITFKHLIDVPQIFISSFASATADFINGRASAIIVAFAVSSDTPATAEFLQKTRELAQAQLALIERAPDLTPEEIAGGEKPEQKTEADVNAIEENILASFHPAAEEAAPEKAQETAPAEEQSAPKAEEPKAEKLEPDDSPFVETASHAIRLDDLKFGRNYHGEE